jgi:hypothetical protein
MYRCLRRVVWALYRKVLQKFVGKMIIWHMHHIVPTHDNGTNDKSNLLKCNVALHAFLHKFRFEEYGQWQDEVAYKALSGMISFAEATKIAQKKNQKGKFKAGNTVWLGRKHSPETRILLSKPKTSRGSGKIFYINNGVFTKTLKIGEAIPEGFYKGKNKAPKKGGHSRYGVEVRVS